MDTNKHTKEVRDKLKQLQEIADIYCRKDYNERTDCVAFKGNPKLEESKSVEK